ncbi:MAG: 1-deoxy-D-xylulose-5-phosphate reductoisomerase [Pseudomonadota bacterium]
MSALFDSDDSNADSQGIAILGSTGSVGQSTLDVVRRHPDKFHVKGLSANSRVDTLFEQCKEFLPSRVVLNNPDSAQILHEKLRLDGVATEVLCGESALCAMVEAQDTQTVMAAIVGAAGLLPTLAAAKKGKKVLLANKESLVMSGALLMDAVRANSAQLLPIDSEHNAIFQCLPQHESGTSLNGVKNLLLTASGGPFREFTLEQLKSVTPQQACAHPIWSMGRKISVDSATLMNKGLELIEACWLFAIDLECIDVVLHPQSIVHSMVTYADGSVLAQMGNPDMRTPIAHALGWPQRIESGAEPLDFFSLSKLTFARPDTKKFPCLELARDAMRIGGTAPSALNAANEIAVQAFLDRKLAFTEIPNVIETTMGKVVHYQDVTLELILSVDREAREMADSLINTQTPVRVPHA